jgi:hypothetical protein
MALMEEVRIMMAISSLKQESHPGPPALGDPVWLGYRIGVPFTASAILARVTRTDEMTPTELDDQLHALSQKGRITERDGMWDYTPLGERWFD